MAYKNIKGYEHYKLYEDGKVYNTKTGRYMNKIEYSSGIAVGLSKDGKQTSFRLTRLMYENYYDDELTDKDVVQFIDGNKNNFHYTNLKKIKLVDMLKQNNDSQTEKAKEKAIIKAEEKRILLEAKNKPIELDETKEWKFMRDNEEYKVSNFADVYSVKSNIILKPNLLHIGYYMIRVAVNKEKQDWLLHRLVYDTFIGMTDKNKVIDHIDRNKLNNHISNLREVTVAENNKNRDVNYKTTKINQYTLEGQFVKLWNSKKEIKEQTKYSYKQIKKNCENKIASADNFKWEYVDKIDVVNDTSEFVPVKTDDDKIYSYYKINKNGDIINEKNIKMKKSITCGYNCINLTSDNGILKFFKINRLVAITFLVNTNNYLVVNHIDENKLNDNVDNLEWCSHEQNMAHSQGKKINQIDIKTGQIIKTFDSISDAQREMKQKSRMGISGVCSGNRKSACGYKWAYVV